MPPTPRNNRRSGRFSPREHVSVVGSSAGACRPVPLLLIAVLVGGLQLAEVVSSPAYRVDVIGDWRLRVRSLERLVDLLAAQGAVQWVWGEDSDPLASVCGICGAIDTHR